MPDPFAHTAFPPVTRLGAPDFPAEVVPVYQRAMDAMEAQGVPFLIGGALAMNAYTGIWRDTKDLDLFCRPDDATRALEALSAAGFAPEVVYESWLGKAWQEGVFVDIIWRNANGLFPVDDDWFDHATLGQIVDRTVRFLPPEELILSKIMVGGRYRFDGADILHVIHAMGDRLDWDRLADAAGEHLGLLVAYLHMYRWGYPGTVERVPDAVVDGLHRRALAARSSSYGPFRALLLDLQSFRVDVEGWGFPDPHRQVLEDIFGEAEGRA